MRYSVTVTDDGSTFHDSVEADSQEEAETKARELIAESWDCQDRLDEARNEGSEIDFDANFDTFTVDPDMDDRMRKAGDALCDLLDEAYSVHIYDFQNDDVPDPADCPYQQAIKEWKEAREA